MIDPQRRTVGLFLFAGWSDGSLPGCGLLAWRGGDHLDFLLLRFLGFPIGSLLTVGHVNLPWVRLQPQGTYHPASDRKALDRIIIRPASWPSTAAKAGRARRNYRHRKRAAPTLRRVRRAAGVDTRLRGCQPGVMRAEKRPPTDAALLSGRDCFGCVRSRLQPVSNGLVFALHFFEFCFGLFVPRDGSLNMTLSL